MQPIQKEKTITKDARLLLVVHDPSGHSENEIKWNPKDKAQVDSILEMFIKMKEQGFMFFKVKKRLGVLKTKGEHIKEFNPKLKKMIVEKNMDWTPVEEENKGFDEGEYFDPETEEVEEDKKYVAAHQIKGG